MVRPAPREAIAELKLDGVTFAVAVEVVHSAGGGGGGPEGPLSIGDGGTVAGGRGGGFGLIMQIGLAAW